MQQYMKTYKVLLEAKGPVYIGSGQQLMKKEYIYNKAKAEIIVPDLVKMYRFLKKKKLEREYEKFLLDPREKDLYMWIRRKGISYAECKKWAKYAYDCSDAELDNRTREISLFMKDAYETPFIPGSSLKGALRTILCVDELINGFADERHAQEIIKRGLKESGRRNTYLQKGIKKIEEDVFHTLEIEDVKKSNSVQDMMKGMIISDSKPLKISDLTLCQKIDVDTRGRRQRMPMLKECIKPGTKIEFDLTIDESINTYYDETILDAVNNFLGTYYHFLNKFETVNEEQNILYLGGGAGFATKTIFYGLFPEREAVRLISEVFDKTLFGKTKKDHHHERDLRLGVSPHIKKCTEYAGREYEFGKCKINIIEV